MEMPPEENGCLDTSMRLFFGMAALIGVVLVLLK